MRRVVHGLLWFLLFGLGGVAGSQAQISSFQHVVIVVQENRTPDNLFQGLCTTSTICSAQPTSSQYNIQTSNWLDKTQPTGLIQPLPVALNASYDVSHTHSAFNRECDQDTVAGVCRMDGAASVACSGTCPTQPQFRYVDNSTGTLTPYLQLAAQYGWANYMFQTNQGPSFPAHQFIFGGTSAPSTASDAAGIYAAENLINSNSTSGCIAQAGTQVLEIAPPNKETTDTYPCFEHNTLPDVLPSNVTWRYYTPKAGSIWTAPGAINHICQPNQPTGGQCMGPMWTNNVDLKSADVLTDIGNCALQAVNWVIPTGQNSDHAGYNSSGGPDWVASIVNAIGQSACTNPDGTSYWASTAILVTWDDWGGWYDHEPPTFLPQPFGDYQLGFRMPFIFVSAYTRAGLIENGRHDFGSMLRFVENNFGVKQGILTFADARATDDLSSFFNLKTTPRPFSTIPSNKSAEFFLRDQSPPVDPDDD